MAEGEKAEENHSHPKPKESSVGSKTSIAKELKSFNAEGNEPAVKTGKRERRKTEFLAATLASPKKKDDGDDGKKKQGKGVKLREIENVKFALDKVKRDDDILVSSSPPLVQDARERTIAQTRRPRLSGSCTKTKRKTERKKSSS